jgi:thiosulfate/3-mercaptopyruvate sulfurtransferase
MSRLWLASFFAFTIGSVPGVQDPQATSSLTVTVDWLAQHLQDPDLVLLHVGEPQEYQAGHLPGAQYLARQAISTPAGSFPVLEMPPVAQLQDTFEKLGISDNSRVVVYFGKDWVTPAARVIVTLDYLGLGHRASLLDGGMPAWISAGKPTTSERTQNSRGLLHPRTRDDVVVDAAWVRARLKDPNLALVDARTPEFYKGESAGMASRAGHIPGAVNIPFSATVEESLKLKDRAALETVFAQAGVKPGQTVVTYCHIGQQASLVYLVARSLGFAARLYDGSFTEWASNPASAVEK